MIGQITRRQFGMAAAAAATGLSPASALAQATSPFERKTIHFYVGIPPGGAYDLVPRIFASHMGKHIPGNPTIVVENMPGAASLTMMNYLYNRAAKDGTAVGFPMNTVLLEPTLKLVSRSGGVVNFDLARMGWLGTPGQDPAVVWVKGDSSIKTFADLRQYGEIRFGATAPGADSYLLPVLCNRLLGTKIKVISGYQGAAEYLMAFERGEIEGGATTYAALSVARPDWIKQGRIRVLAQFGATRSPDLPDVPTAIELASDDDSRAMLSLFAVKFTAAYPVALPPDVPADRRDMLRAAFVATTKDPAFLADLAKLNIPPGAVSAQEVEDLLRGATQVSPALVDRLRGVLTVE